MRLLARVTAIGRRRALAGAARRRTRSALAEERELGARFALEARVQTAARARTGAHRVPA
jgi:hypothetical protein